MNMTMSTVSSTVPGVIVQLDNPERSSASLLYNLVQSGVAIEREIAGLQDQIREINGAIADEAQQYIGHAESLHIKSEDVYCTVSLGSEIVVDDVNALQEILGDSFDELVKVFPCRPDSRLIAMAADADNPQAKQIAACLRVQEAATVVSYIL